jgi:hypothetical protein
MQSAIILIQYLLHIPVDNFNILLILQWKQQSNSNNTIISRTRTVIHCLSAKIKALSLDSSNSFTFLSQNETEKRLYLTITWAFIKLNFASW